MNEINYSVSFNRPFTHYCEVEISLKDLKDLKEDSIDFSMPVWTPGSYLVREFARNVDNVSAENSSGKNLNFEKINKNTWRVDIKGQSELKLKYRVYCNESTVRTSEINSDHAFLSSSGIFMFVRDFENKKCNLKINLPPEWSKISTGLIKESETEYSAENYDVFIDSPLEIGNQKVLEFDVKGIRHFICLSGKGFYDEEVLVNDFKAIVEEEVKFFGGDIPYEHYTFIIHIVEKGGGGLEHLNSFVVQIGRWYLKEEKFYKKFLGLVSHEFFHLWNVKRIRPEGLGPFNYDKENHSKSLWVAEGFTSFFDNLILKRCGLLEADEYYEFLDREINDVMRKEGRFHQSLEESSFDTWIKYYRQDENYTNSQISYYTKGSVVALMLNIEIIKSTDCKKSLDDVMRMLYEDYKKDNSKGFSDKRIKEICENVCGKNLNEFWEKYISGKDEIPVNEYLNYAGLEIVDKNESLPASLDIETKTEEGKIIITKVFSGYSGYESGLNSNDELISVNGFRTNKENFKNLTRDVNTGDEVKIIISRKGLIMEMNVKLLKPMSNYSVSEIDNKNTEQEKIFNKWLTGEKID